MTEALGFLYGVQYAAALPKPRPKTSREANKEIAKISLGFSYQGPHQTNPHPKASLI